MRIKQQKIEDFLDKLSSNSPTPGGGAVAALVGAMAASLVEMVANLTIGKKGYEKQQKDVEILRYKAVNAKKKLLDLADEDVKAFDQVLTAYKSKDKKRIEKALMKATEIPLGTAKVSSELEKVAARIAKIGNKNANSDANTAMHLSQAAKLSALENVRINLKLINSEAFKKRIKTQAGLY